MGDGQGDLVLAVATVGVAVESEILVHAATEATEAVGLSPIFLGLIVIPIIGNAAEHATAVMVARKGQIDLALQIALGSSTQVALLVAPILVFVGLVLGADMDLVFARSRWWPWAWPRSGGDHPPGRGVALVRGGATSGRVRHGGVGAFFI